jgi:hypothetical protein
MQQFDSLMDDLKPLQIVATALPGAWFIGFRSPGPPVFRVFSHPQSVAHRVERAYRSGDTYPAAYFFIYVSAGN